MTDGMRGRLNSLLETALMTHDDPFWVYCQDEVRALVDHHAQVQAWPESHRAQVLDMLGLA